MYAEMQVTGQRPGSSGTIAQRGSRDGHQVIQDSHAHFMQAVLDGNVYTGANPQATAVTTQAGLSATTPALTLYNPIGSGVNLVLWRLSIGLTAAPAAATVFSLAFNLANAAAPTSVTLGNVTNNQLGNAALPRGQCYRVATLAAAPVAFWFPWGVSAASLVSPTNGDFVLDGTFVILPGVAVSIQTTTAAAIIASFTWEEVAP